MTEEEVQGSIARRLDLHSVDVPIAGCRIWTGATNEHGYGILSAGKHRRVKAHRAAWELANGPIPEGVSRQDKCILHRCDTPGCINPHHLYLGSQAQNMRDVAEKARRKGIKHHFAKLDDEAVSLIRSSGSSNRALAEKYGVDPSNISHVRRGRIWSHVQE